MRLTLTLIVLIAALTLGMLTVANSMQTARAGDDDSDNTGDDTISICRNDDGDDDLDSNPEPVDNPDSEDNPGEFASPSGTPVLIVIGGPEAGDPEDHDPPREADDCVRPTPFGFCDGMTEPGVYLFTGLDYTGFCLHLTEDAPSFVDICTPDVCSWNDVPRSMMLVGDVGDVYLCLHTPPDYPGGYCVLYQASAPNLGSLDLESSSLFFGVNPLSVPVPDPGGVEAQSYAAADANCDGGVGVGDALANLEYLSGFQAGCVGNWNGDAFQGDADCSGAIGGGDVTAILAAVATGGAPGC